jgi:hypothetical protein
VIPDDESEYTFCGGNAEPDDDHLAADVVAIDEGILEVLAERKRRTKEKRERKCLWR